MDTVSIAGHVQFEYTEATGIVITVLDPEGYECINRLLVGAITAIQSDLVRGRDRRNWQPPESKPHEDILVCEMLLELAMRGKFTAWEFSRELERRYGAVSSWYLDACHTLLRLLEIA